MPEPEKPLPPDEESWAAIERLAPEVGWESGGTPPQFRPSGHSTRRDAPVILERAVPDRDLWERR